MPDSDARLTDTFLERICLAGYGHAVAGRTDGNRGAPDIQDLESVVPDPSALSRNDPGSARERYPLFSCPGARTRPPAIAEPEPQPPPEERAGEWQGWQAPLNRCAVGQTPRNQALAGGIAPSMRMACAVVVRLHTSPLNKVKPVSV